MMNKNIYKHLFCLCCLLSSTVQAQLVTVTDTIFNRAAYEEKFAFGADISWLSQQESWKTVYRNRKGQAQDLMVILKEQGVNALRFRVWVNPSGGWSGKQDVVNLCKRAHKLGFKLLVGFHYSDTWADPGSQTKPAAWTDHTFDELLQDVYDHTFDVLQALKAEGITPEWVQIGNETKRGMLWPDGKTSDSNGYARFAQLINSAYKAIKDNDPSTQAIIHLPEGHNNSLYRSMFDQLKKYNAKYDIIGMSAYPRWSHLDGPIMITQTLSNVRDLKSRYGKPVIAVEMGHYNNKPIESNHYLVDFMNALIKDHDLGAFYWEPEAMSGYDLGAWDPVTHQASLAMDAYLGLKHTEITSYMTAKMSTPLNGVLIENGEEVALAVNASHVRNRISKVEMYLNKQLDTTFTAAPYKYVHKNVPGGIYRAYAKATDSDKHEQLSDTVAFLVGPFAAFEKGDTLLEARTMEMQWNVYVPDSGAYNVVFKYHSPKGKIARLNMGGTQRSLIFGATAQTDFREAKCTLQAGRQTIGLWFSSLADIPTLEAMYLLPQEGQTLPTPVPSAIDRYSSQTEPSVFFSGKELYITTANACQQKVELFNLSGKKLMEETLYQNNSVVSCHRLSPGFYLVRVVTDHREKCYKCLLR